ncbi:hypothetical protein ACHAPA_003990 [Fusarium lateritium]
MAFDCGFDIFPHLVPNEENKIAYRRFLRKVSTLDKKQFCLVFPTDADFPEVLSKNFIHFLIPGLPNIPFGDNCDCFLSFRSNDALNADALNIVHAIASIARRFFGSRVTFWKGQSQVYSRGELRGAEEEVQRRPEYKLEKIATKDEPDMPAKATNSGM